MPVIGGNVGEDVESASTNSAAGAQISQDYAYIEVTGSDKKEGHIFESFPKHESG